MIRRYEASESADTQSLRGHCYADCCDTSICRYEASAEALLGLLCSPLSLPRPQIRGLCSGIVGFTVLDTRLSLSPQIRRLCSGTVGFTVLAAVESFDLQILGLYSGTI